jgi:iron-sulfur cluster assembly accessory protein
MNPMTSELHQIQNLMFRHQADSPLSKFSHPSTRPANIVVDAMSLALVKGATIDFATELIGSNFRISDNPQAKNSGCGCGVSWEAKV